MCCAISVSLSLSLRCIFLSLSLNKMKQNQRQAMKGFLYYSWMSSVCVCEGRASSAGTRREGKGGDGDGGEFRPTHGECATMATMIIKCQKMPTVREPESNYGKGKTKTVMFRMFRFVLLCIWFHYHSYVCKCVH